MNKSEQRLRLISRAQLWTIAGLLGLVFFLASNATAPCASAASCGVGDSETFAAGVEVNTDQGTTTDDRTRLWGSSAVAISGTPAPLVDVDPTTDTVTVAGTLDAAAATLVGFGSLQNIVTFTSSGTYTPSTDTQAFLAYCTGSGGGGGGFNSTTNPNYPGTAGGGGGTAVALVTSPAASYAVTIGAVGTGGAANANGTAGGNTTLGSPVVCQGTGGSGGFFDPPVGGSGGTCGTSDFCIVGGDGATFNATDTTGFGQTLGGTSWRGGSNGNSRGTGGKGGYVSSTSGSNGVAGSIVIFEYN